MAWNFEYGGAVPPLPGVAASTAVRPARIQNLLKEGLERAVPHGCWQILMEPKNPAWIAFFFHPGFHYEGTLRLDWLKPERKESSQLFGSGDLYVVRRGEEWEWSKPPGVSFRLRDDIPIFPRDKYSHYMRLQRLTALSSDKIELEIELVRYSRNPPHWTLETTLIARLDRKGKKKIFQGELFNSEQDEIVATITLGHVSPHLRRARIEIDKIGSVKAWPMDNGAEESWESVFERAGWKVEAGPSDLSVDDPREPWTDARLHAHMLRWRDAKSSILDTEWLYHLLCVDQLADGVNFGIMYDTPNPDLENDIPREGAAVAGHAVISDAAYWPEEYRGKRIQDLPEVYFRTAVHEIGHAMGLYHNHNNFGIMQTTSELARAGRLPDKIDWSFSPEDRRRLCHFPDLWVRPGGLPWGFSYPLGPVPIADVTVEPKSLQLEVVGLDECLPFGAPLRVGVALRNTGRRSWRVPPEISFKSGRMAGRVIEPFGGEHAFYGLTRFLSYSEFRDLCPGQALYRSETLLRGQRGFLFTAPGHYRVEIDVAWDHPRGRVKVSGATQVLVLPPASEQQAALARHVIATPQLMIPLVFGLGSEQVSDTRFADGLKKAERVLRKLLRSRVLRPHFAMLRARLDIATGKLRAAARRIDADSRLSASEIERFLALVEGAPARVERHRDVRRLIRTLRRLWDDLEDRDMPRDPEVRRRVRRLLRRSKGKP